MAPTGPEANGVRGSAQMIEECMKDQVRCRPDQRPDERIQVIGLWTNAATDGRTNTATDSWSHGPCRHSMRHCFVLEKWGLRCDIDLLL